MAKGQTKQATEMSKDIYKRAPETFKPITSALGGETVAGGTGPSVGEEAKAGFENMANTGGYDPNQLAKITGGYESLLGGGLSEQEKADYLNAATSGISGTYGVLRQQQQRERAAQGQGGGGGEYLALGREMERATADANLRARTGLQQLLSANEQAGLAGLYGTESGVAAGRREGVAGEAGLNQQLFNALVAQTGSQEEATALMSQLSKNPGLFGNITQFLASLPVKATVPVP